jgi:hypothetical protein
MERGILHDVIRRARLFPTQRRRRLPKDIVQLQSMFKTLGKTKGLIIRRDKTKERISPVDQRPL